MPRYIDADALIEFIDVGHLRPPSELCFSELDVVNMLNHAPSEDVRPNVRGKWQGYNTEEPHKWVRDDGEPIFLVCSKCNGTVLNNGSAHWNFCPNCGSYNGGDTDE